MATRAETKKAKANKPTQPKTVGGRINRMLNPTPGQSKMQTPTDATRASDIKALKNFIPRMKMEEGDEYCRIFSSI